MTARHQLMAQQCPQRHGRASRLGSLMPGRVGAVETGERLLDGRERRNVGRHAGEPERIAGG